MPLTAKGRKIKAAMTKQYGSKEGTSVFYASKNKGTITGVDAFNEGAHPRGTGGQFTGTALGSGAKRLHETSGHASHEHAAAAAIAGAPNARMVSTHRGSRYGRTFKFHPPEQAKAYKPTGGDAMANDWRATYDRLVARTKDGFPDNPPARPQGRKNDALGTVLSPKRSIESNSEGGTADRKMFFKGSVRDALRRGMPARDAFRTALDRMTAHDALPPKVRASFDRVLFRR